MKINWENSSLTKLQPYAYYLMCPVFVSLALYKIYNFAIQHLKVFNDLKKSNLKLKEQLESEKNKAKREEKRLILQIDRLKEDLIERKMIKPPTPTLGVFEVEEKKEEEEEGEGFGYVIKPKELSEKEKQRQQEQKDLAEIIFHRGFATLEITFDEKKQIKNFLEILNCGMREGDKKAMKSFLRLMQNEQIIKWTFHKPSDWFFGSDKAKLCTNVHEILFTMFLDLNKWELVDEEVLNLLKYMTQLVENRVILESFYFSCFHQLLDFIEQKKIIRDVQKLMPYKRKWTHFNKKIIEPKLSSYRRMRASNPNWRDKRQRNKLKEIRIKEGEFVENELLQIIILKMQKIINRHPF